MTSSFLSAFVEETRDIDLQLIKESIEELSFDAPEPDLAYEGSDQSGSISANGLLTAIDERLGKIEENYTKVVASRTEKEAILERLSSQGSILEYLINQQQNQFAQFEEQLKKISAQIDRLRHAVLANGARVDQPSSLVFDATIKKEIR